MLMWYLMWRIIWPRQLKIRKVLSVFGTRNDDRFIGNASTNYDVHFPVKNRNWHSKFRAKFVDQSCQSRSRNFNDARVGSHAWCAGISFFTLTRHYASTLQVCESPVDVTFRNANAESYCSVLVNPEVVHGFFTLNCARSMRDVMA